MSHSSKGREGEDRAAAMLEDAGMEVLARNFRSRRGEVDIVVLDGDTIVFVEVKSWDRYGFADLQYGINEQKQRRIIETAKFFLQSHRQYNEMKIRFDVIFAGPDGTFKHLASAFTESV